VRPALDPKAHSAFDPAEPSPREDKNTRDRSLAEWAALLLPLVQQMRHSAPDAVATAVERNPVATGSQSVLSPSLESQTSDTPVNDPGPSRLVLSVTSETLGQIDLIVDRDHGGVRIAIGATSEAQQLISADKFALLQNLAKSGVNVRSLGVMSRESVGTVLAEGKLKLRNVVPERQEPGTPERKTRKRISLIG
jgi:hypothetical protein